MASAVANCSEDPGCGPMASRRSKEPHRRLAINKTAGRTRLSEDMSPVYTELERATAEAVSATAAAPALASTRWLSLGFAALTRPGTGGGANNAAGWTGRRREPHAASKGTTTRRIGSALRTGHGRTGQMCDECCDQKSHRNIFADFAPSGRNP